MIMEQNIRSLVLSSKKEKAIKRSKSAIILNILSVCTKGASKTKIVYRANLNFKTATPYIELLSINGLLHTRGDSSRLYETTPHGIEVMKTLRQLGNDLLWLWKINLAQSSFSLWSSLGCYSNYPMQDSINFWPHFLLLYSSLRRRRNSANFPLILLNFLLTILIMQEKISNKSIQFSY